ncbi:DUF6477 family protein [Antarcticimicrobium sediminis]|uniref:Uncharacterized protein n=1 Tax=Antarcticimicrobium sediminis TaxID=2546227 RepID=A0A4R5EU19_9RHOB|nr:DUF6477 family protein [Antarcticimicrobium sediminis]TDE38378.1 hypothetical protein E1B25_09650 [Antarcticimicrobium sediminis]
MKDLHSLLATCRRPRLLVRAARIGAQEYRRDRHLLRLLGYGGLPSPAPALIRLMEMEGELNDSRRENDAGYSLIRHLDILIAIVGEAHLLDLQWPRPIAVLPT